MKVKLEKFSNFVIFQTASGKVHIDVFFKDDNLWLTQKKIAELFETTKQNISLHLKNIFADNELEEISVVKDFLTTAEDGKNYKTKFYNLDAIIAVGYRVNSYQATQFRIWATKIIKEYTIKGFAMDDNRLKQIKNFGKDYFEPNISLKEAISKEGVGMNHIASSGTAAYLSALLDPEIDEEVVRKAVNFGYVHQIDNYILNCNEIEKRVTNSLF